MQRDMDAENRERELHDTLAVTPSS
jgi:hypothetical protein